MDLLCLGELSRVNIKTCLSMPKSAVCRVKCQPTIDDDSHLAASEINAMYEHTFIFELMILIWLPLLCYQNMNIINIRIV